MTIKFIGEKETLKMIDFSEIELKDKERINNALMHASEIGCMYCFGAQYLWQWSFGFKKAFVNGCFTALIKSDEGFCCMYPVGGDEKAAIEALRQEASERNETFALGYISDANKEKLEEMFPGQFDFVYYRDSCDYVYRTKDLAALSGRKYHSKKNHVNHFVNSYHDWSVEDISRDNIEECKALIREWFKENEEKMAGRVQLGELDAVLRSLDCFEELGFVGILLRVAGEPVALTAGEPMMCKICFCSHFEKALARAEGAYAFINMQFAKYIEEHFPEAIYINREEDLGIEGLRKAKESYRPAFLHSFYVAKSKKG